MEEEKVHKEIYDRNIKTALRQQNIFLIEV